MQLCNDTITLYNRRFDPEQDCDVYERTIIRGVHWFNSDATTVDSTGLKAANKVTIRIPVDADFGGKAYLLPKQYAATDDPAAAFTLAAGDLVVLGVGTEGLHPAAIHDTYSEAATILQVTDNRRAPQARHWKVVGA